jgi:hypothetical protein
VWADAAGEIRFYSGGSTLRAKFTSAGDFLPSPDGSRVLGSASLRWGGLYLNAASVTGTALYVDAASNVGPLTSSVRYKEHLAPWAVTPEALDRFLRTAPQLWDYKGQANGAVGFIAEDLDALPIRNAYGTSPLVNYDKEGRPESNRDYALIALQHLAIQHLSARVARLEGAH